MRQGRVIYYIKALSVSNDILKLPKTFPSVEKNWFEIFDFLSIFEQVKQSSNACYIKKLAIHAKKIDLTKT